MKANEDENFGYGLARHEEPSPFNHLSFSFFLNEYSSNARKDRMIKPAIISMIAQVAFSKETKIIGLNRMAKPA